MTRITALLVSVLMLFALPATGQTEADVRCQVLVYGDSLAGVTAAITAARLGADTCMQATVGYSGGQATAAAVSTMDEGSVILRNHGFYGELIHDLITMFGLIPMQVAYFASVNGADLIGPDPRAIRTVLDQKLVQAGVRIYPNAGGVSDVLQQGNVVYGIVDNAGVTYNAQVVIDASDWQELYPLIEGLQYVAGDPAAGCVQDTTWTASLNWYPSPDGVPEMARVHPNLINQMRRAYGADQINVWLEQFRGALSNGPEAVRFTGSWEGLNDVAKSFDGPGGYVDYRAVIDTRPGIREHPDAPDVTQTTLNWANDSPMSIAALTDPALRQQELWQAQDKTMLLMWFVRWELGIDDWGLSAHLGYNEIPRGANNPNVSDRLEENLPLSAYPREGLRLANAWDTLNGNHLKLRGQDQWSNSVMLGAYFTDTHGCRLDPALTSGDGLYDVPMGIFIPKTVEGFMTGMARAGGVDRAASSSLRMQPSEIGGAEAAAVIAALAVKNGIQPSQVSAELVRQTLRDLGAAIDVHN